MHAITLSGQELLGAVQQRVWLVTVFLCHIEAYPVIDAVWMHQATLKGIIDCLAHAAAIQTAWGVIFRLPEGCSMLWICKLKEAAYHTVHPYTVPLHGGVIIQPSGKNLNNSCLQVYSCSHHNPLKVCNFCIVPVCRLRLNAVSLS